MMDSLSSLPAHWQEWLRMWAMKRSGGKYDGLGANDFRGSVKLSFDDGSFALFENAFHAVDEAREEIAVFTEHCGHHVFPLPGLQCSYNVWAKSPGIEAEPDHPNEQDWTPPYGAS